MHRPVVAGEAGAWCARHGVRQPHQAPGSPAASERPSDGDREARVLAGPGSRVVDLRGAVVTAGRTDGRLHPMSGADRTMGVDLSGCQGLTAVRTAPATAVRGLRRAPGRAAGGLDPGSVPDGISASSTCSTRTRRRTASARCTARTSAVPAGSRRAR
ncbi:hypothetical protein [Streptomyces sp. NPDC053069]|uniref:hypothetical protein n=1 Tax=Streptomyces sp. NPDC053069 TaxID=3365695 RepID=UPI0037D022A2